jgi:levanase/fructan beta-fructosidase
MPETDRRRIQVGWMRGGAYPDMPFNQQITFPCALALRTLPEGIRMCKSPIHEIEKLYGERFVLRDTILKPGDNPLADVKGELFEIVVEIDISKSASDQMVLNVRGNLVTYVVADKQLVSCGSRVTLEPRSGQIQLRILVDRMSVETFGNWGEVSITNCVPSQDVQPPLSLCAVGGCTFIASLTVHELQSIWQ